MTLKEKHDIWDAISGAGGLGVILSIVALAIATIWGATFWAQVAGSALVVLLAFTIIGAFITSTLSDDLKKTKKSK